MKSAFDEVPYGYERATRPGWIKPAKTPTTSAIRQLKADKDKLEAELAELKEMVGGLVSKKGKK